MKDDYADSGLKEKRSASYAVPGEKAPKARNQTENVYSQPDKGKKKTKNGTEDSAPIEFYAQPDKSKKQKEGQEEYTQVDKSRKKQQGPQHADLDPSAMKRSTATRAETSVQYSKVRATQLPPRSA
jgi:hypothetical protein